MLYRLPDKLKEIKKGVGGMWSVLVCANTGGHWEFVSVC